MMAKEEWKKGKYGTLTNHWALYRAFTMTEIKFSTVAQTWLKWLEQAVMTIRTQSQICRDY